MTAKYYAILTTLGAAKLANAMALGTKLEITTMAVGDGGGVLPTPDASQTAIVGEQRRAPINMLSIDAANPGQIIAEQVIPENEGGFWIRTIGLYDKDGTLIAVANCPETYKPQLQEGSGRTQTIRMILIVSNTDAITLKIDPSVVLATRKYVDDRTIEVKAYADELMAAHLAAANPHNQYAPKASPALTGTPTAPTPVKTDNTTKLATTAHVKQVVADYAPLANPALTGKPTAPTAAQTSNDTQLATTAFVKAAITALIDSSPAAMDTLNELAAALGNDPNFATTMTTELSKKMDKASNGADIPDVAAFLANLGLRKSVAETGYFKIDDYQFVWGRGSTASNGIGNVQFPHAFVGVPYLVMPSDISSTPDGVNAVGWDLINTTAAGARVFSADSKASGIATTFSYIAIGKGAV
ncbi:phage tail protein [Atlantibacter hermannii]|uniref:phage tail protein n=1 Tax=Atlantibacter hermannii TaxID=565 RepID=UPI002072ADA1|nr:phage tail protein [Atlantibacter hermannii]